MVVSRCTSWHPPAVKSCGGKAVRAARDVLDFTLPEHPVK